MTVVTPVPPVPIAVPAARGDALEPAKSQPRKAWDGPVPAKKATKNMSSGVGPSSSAYRSASTQELERLCYTTTTGTQFAGRNLDADGRTENMGAILLIGQQRTNKYLNFQLKQAPLLDRSSCHYTRAFSRPPSAGTLASDIAEFVKLKQAMPRGKQAKLQGTTRYSEQFCDWSSEASRTVAYKPHKGCKDPIGKVTDHSAERLSHSHNTHSGIRPFSATERARPPRSNVGPSNSFFEASAYHTSHYDRNFVDPSTLKLAHREGFKQGHGQHLQRCSSAPAGGRGSRQ